MTNYVTKNQVFKGAWAVFVVFVTVAGWSFKVIADYSTRMGKIETTIENEIERRRADEIIIKSHTDAIAILNTKYAEQRAENKYMLQMMEMLLKNEQIPLPERPKSDE